EDEAGREGDEHVDEPDDRHAGAESRCFRNDGTPRGHRLRCFDGDRGPLGFRLLRGLDRPCRRFDGWLRCERRRWDHDRTGWWFVLLGWFERLVVVVFARLPALPEAFEERGLLRGVLDRGMPLRL